MFKEILADAFPIIEKFAPIVATALGCPIPAIASVALNLVSSAFECQKKDLPSLIQTIIADPNAEAKLTQVAGSLPNISEQSISNMIRLPTDFEINVKIHWDATNHIDN